MEHAYTLATVWCRLALIATFLALRLKISMALMEIIVGVVAGYLATQLGDMDA